MRKVLGAAIAAMVMTIGLAGVMSAEDVTVDDVMAEFEARHGAPVGVDGSQPSDQIERNLRAKVDRYLTGQVNGAYVGPADASVGLLLQVLVDMEVLHAYHGSGNVAQSVGVQYSTSEAYTERVAGRTGNVVIQPGESIFP